jgi:hypothetical protein
MSGYKFLNASDESMLLDQSTRTANVELGPILDGLIGWIEAEVVLGPFFKLLKFGFVFVRH